MTTRSTPSISYRRTSSGRWVASCEDNHVSAYGSTRRDARERLVRVRKALTLLEAREALVENVTSTSPVPGPPKTA